MRILVIEDEAKLADYVKRGLTESGYTVDVARDGIEGRYLATGGDYQLVVLDIMLPEVSGYDICANVRKDHSLEAVKIIMMTARGSSHQRSKCIGLGANAFIEKPFDLTALRQELKRQIAPA